MLKECAGATAVADQRYHSGSIDRRASPRFGLRVPVLARWQDDLGNARDAAGFSRDISSRGVFVVSSFPPPKSTRVTIEVLIPNLKRGAQELHLRSEGSVVRVEEHDKATGYAVDCDFNSPALQDC